MLFTKIATLIVASLAGTAWSKPVELSRRAMTQIGVRHMSQAEVTAIGDALKLVYDPEAGNKGGELGKGIYVASSAFGYMYEQMHAAVSIDSGVWDGLKKIYIPDDVNGDYILSNEDKIRAYISSKGEDPERAIRLKDDMDGTSGQILIPAKLFEEGISFSISKPVAALDTLSTIHNNMHDWSNVVEIEEEEEEEESSSDEEDGDDDDDDDDDDGFW